MADPFAFFIAYRIMVRQSSGFFDIFKLADALQLVLQALAGLRFHLEFLLSLLKVTFLLRNQGHFMLSCKDNRFNIALHIKDFFEFMGQDYFVVLQNPKNFLKFFSQAHELLP